MDLLLFDSERCERWLFRGGTQRAPGQFGERWVGARVAAIDKTPKNPAWVVGMPALLLRLFTSGHLAAPPPGGLTQLVCVRRMGRETDGREFAVQDCFETQLLWSEVVVFAANTAT